MPPVAQYERVAYTVGNFVQRYIEILATEGGSMRAANFALTGCDSERQQQATVQPLANPYRAHQRHATMLRDYDSVFGFHDELGVNCDIYIYPVSNPAQTLKQNIHIKVPFDLPGQVNVKMNPHIIPNMAFATAGERILIRLFVPGLYAEDGDSYIHLNQQAMIYNDGIRAAIMQLTPEAGQNWCTNHQDAIFRARNHSRGMQYGTKAVSGYDADALCRLIKMKLEGQYGWARGIRFMVQIKGVKEAYQHDSRDAEHELQRLLGDFDTETGQWYVDVGLEVSEPGLALQWTTDGQAAVISHVAGIPQHRATRATNLSNRKYRRDTTALLVDLSGCGLTLASADQGPYEVKYIQMYTTDKAVVYHVEGSHHAKYLSGKMAIEGNPPVYTGSLYRVYQNASEHIDCGARVEVRVPLEEAATVLQTLPVRVLEESLVVFSRKNWWSWKGILIHAMGRILSVQNIGPKQQRFSPESIYLTVGIVWLANAIHSRPEDDSSSRDVMLAVLPLTDDYNQGNLLFIPPQNRPDGDPPIPHCPNGVIFLRDLVLPPDVAVPRLRWGGMMNNRSFQKFFQCDYAELFKSKVHPGILNKADISKMHIPTRKGATHFHRNENPVILQTFEHMELELPAPAFDNGSDLPVEDIIQGEPLEDSALVFTRLWNQFCSDMLQKCGNKRNDHTGASFCRISMTSREQITEQTYINLNLARVFNKVQWRVASREVWKNIFCRFWPNKGHVTGPSTQNFKSMEYFRAYKTLIADMDSDDVNEARSRLWARFQLLSWVPDAVCDRVWSYGEDSRFNPFPVNKVQKAPHIIMGPDSAAPIWDPTQRQATYSEHGAGAANQPELLRDAEDDEEDEDEDEEDRDEEANVGIGGMPGRNMSQYMHLREEEEASE